MMALVLEGPAHAGVVSVREGTSIQSAVDNAMPGDVVLVDGGIYKENLILDKGVSLKGNGSAMPVVDASGKGTAVTISADDASIEGFRITGSGSGDRDAGIRVAAQGCTVRENTVTGNHIGVLLQDARDVLVAGNNVDKNQVGVYLETSYGNEISSNRIVQNTEGIHITRVNVSKSVKTAEDGSVSIKYRPKAEGSSYNVSEIGFAGAYEENLIYGNQLLDNERNAFDDGDNLWNAEGEGNRYDDFDAIDEGCRDRNKDGICDSGYAIQGGSRVDSYPQASEDAVLRYRAGSDGYELCIYRTTFQPGGQVDLSYLVLENFTGWVGVMPSELHPEGAKTEDALFSKRLDDQSGSLSSQAPAEEGSYELRIYDEAGVELATLPFSVMLPSLATSTQSASSCDRIEVNYSGAPGFDGDWIGLYGVGVENGDALSRQYLEGKNSGTLTFTAPSAPGRYEFRMFEDDGYGLLATSSAVEVKAASGVRIEASPSKVSPGGLVEVSFWGAKPDSAVGMYEMTSPDKFMLAMQYVNGRPCGTLTFRAPTTPGRYDFRLFENNVYRKHMGASNVITVG